MDLAQAYYLEQPEALVDVTCYCDDLPIIEFAVLGRLARPADAGALHLVPILDQLVARADALRTAGHSVRFRMPRRGRRGQQLRGVDSDARAARTGRMTVAQMPDGLRVAMAAGSRIVHDASREDREVMMRF